MSKNRRNFLIDLIYFAILYNLDWPVEFVPNLKQLTINLTKFNEDVVDDIYCINAHLCMLQCKKSIYNRDIACR